MKINDKKKTQLAMQTAKNHKRDTTQTQQVVPAAPSSGNNNASSFLDGGGGDDAVVVPGATFWDGGNQLAVVRIEMYDIGRHVRCQLVKVPPFTSGIRWLEYDDVVSMIREQAAAGSLPSTHHQKRHDSSSRDSSSPVPGGDDAQQKLATQMTFLKIQEQGTQC